MIGGVPAAVGSPIREERNAVVALWNDLMVTSAAARSCSYQELTVGLNHYAMLRRQAGDRAGADRIERFGLTDDGALASEWWNTTLLPTRQQPGQGG
jgi:hypothetical protein